MTRGINKKKIHINSKYRLQTFRGICEVELVWTSIRMVQGTGLEGVGVRDDKA